VESLDRLSRQTARKALRTLESIVEEGIVVVTLGDGREYTQASLDQDPLSLLMSLFVFIRSHEESLTKSRRLKAAWSAKRAKAVADKVPMTAKTPAWIESKANKLRLIPERAKVVRRVYRETLRGSSPWQIATALNKEGVPAFGTGRHWHRSYVIKLLANPAAMGDAVLRSYKDGRHSERMPMATVTGYFPAVVTAQQWRRVQDMRTSRQPKVTSKGITSLLAGLALCPVCGGRTTTSNKGDGWLYLVCAAAKVGACTYKAIRYGDVEQALLERWEELLDLAPSGSKEGRELDRQLEDVQAGMEGNDAAIEAMVEAMETGRRPVAAVGRLAELEAEREQLKAKESELIAKHAALAPDVVSAKIRAARAAFEAMNRPAINAALRQLLSGVVVDHRDMTLVFRWRHTAMESSIMFGMPAVVEQ
jgi:hypothetical protein